MSLLSKIFGRKKLASRRIDAFTPVAVELECIGHLDASISHTQTNIVIKFKDNRIGKAYPKGTGVYLYRRSNLL